jgi:hypothetical protein
MKPKTAGLLILLLALLGTGISGVAMARRAATFNQTLPDLFHFERQFAREFFFRGKPVSLQDSKTPDGQPALTLRFGDATATLRVHPPSVPNFVDLAVYEEHVTVLSFQPLQAGQKTADPYSDKDWRAVVVNRRTPEGWQQETWGNVRVRDWVFEVFELTADGTITKRQMQFPDRRGRLPAEVDARREAAAEGRTLPDGPLDLGIEKIQERTWEWQACLFSMPRAQVSRYRFRTDAIDGSGSQPGMGWTLPFMGVSILGAVVGGLMMMLASTKREPFPAAR